MNQQPLKCQVLRGRQGEVHYINSEDLVVGDVLMLRAGDSVAADCVLLETQNMVVNQRHIS